jgi:DNA-binding transcriptional LysR family regulator
VLLDSCFQLALVFVMNVTDRGKVQDKPDGFMDTVPMMGQRIDVDGALVFVKVVEEGSFRGAARALGIPKSNVSRKVTELEEHLGARLLQRTTRHVGLTDAGAAYYRHATIAVATLQDAERAVSDLQEKPTGMLRLTASINFGLLFLPAVVREFLAEHPEVQVTIDLSDRMVDLVEEGFDLAIRAGALPDSSFVAQRLGGTQLGIFASPGYLKKRGIPKTPDELAVHDCLIYGLSLATTWAFRGVRKPRQLPVTGRLVSNNYLFLRDAATAGLGIVRAPELIALEGLRRGRLQTVLDDFLLPETPIHVIYPSARQLSPKVRAFVAFLKTRFSPPPWQRLKPTRT